MWNGTGWGWGALLVLIGTVARAQAIAWSVPPEYRPTLAVLEVAAADLDSIERAQQLEAELLALLADNEQFGRVTLVRQQTFDVGCTERKCFEAALAQLSVQRAARVTVERIDDGSRVTLLGLDPSLPELLRAQVDVPDSKGADRTPAERDLEFLDKALPQLRAAFWALAVPNAKLVVENADPALTVLVDGAIAGRGRVEVFRPHGDVLVSIGGTLYEASDHAVTLKPGETTTVELHLVAKAVVPVMVKKPYAGLMTRPAAYVAMSGLTLLALGAGFGFGTLVTGARLAEPGAPVQVTRLDAMNAPAQAIVANVLIAAGVALSAGGIAWIALTPSSTSLGVDRATQGWTLSLGGRL
jgi:hypothetical protein